MDLALETGANRVAVYDLLARFRISREVFYFHFKSMDELYDFAVDASRDEVAGLIERRESLRGPAAAALVDIWLAVLFGTDRHRLIVLGEPETEIPSAQNVYGQLLVTSHRLLLRAIREGDLRCAEDAYNAAVLMTRIMLMPSIVTEGRGVPSAAALERAISITAHDIGIRTRQPYLREYLVRRLLLLRGERWRIAHLDRRSATATARVAGPFGERIHGKGLTAKTRTDC
ncbi:hypothetical protein NBRGN_026_00670 [Nocardia brasiliensis NBRC 14402]|nr:hypothetical protein NBRGN_026_00670 [Nocardia brasiliensis NBRC 14402]